MAEEENGLINGGEAEGELKYKDLVTDEPERDIEDDYEPPRTLSQSEQETEQKTDMQSVLKALIPTFPNKRLQDLLQPAMVSRVFPDNYLDKNFMIAMSLIEEYEPDDCNVDVIAIISWVQDALSKAFEGRHIIDLLELYGVAREEELADLAKNMGL